MRPVTVLSLLVGLILGSACGSVIGIAAASNFYEYHVLSTGDDPIKMVDEDGWEPLANLNPTGRTVPLYYRRPRIRLP